MAKASNKSSKKGVEREKSEKLLKLLIDGGKKKNYILNKLNIKSSQFEKYKKILREKGINIKFDRSSEVYTVSGATISSKKAAKKPEVKKNHSPVKKEIKRMENKIASERKQDINKALTDNFIALQKVMVNLSAKFDGLSTQVSKLLELFEISAKSLAEKDFEKNKEDKSSKDILEKLDNISQQAGLIGKGLVLIHEANSGKGFGTPHDDGEKWRSMEPSMAIKPMHFSPRKPIPMKKPPVKNIKPMNPPKLNPEDINQNKPAQENNTPQNPSQKTQEVK